MISFKMKGRRPVGSGFVRRATPHNNTFTQGRGKNGSEARVSGQAEACAPHPFAGYEHRQEG